MCVRVHDPQRGGGGGRARHTPGAPLYHAHVALGINTGKLVPGLARYFMAPMYTRTILQYFFLCSGRSQRSTYDFERTCAPPLPAPLPIPAGAVQLRIRNFRHLLKKHGAGR